MYVCVDCFQNLIPKWWKESNRVKQQYVYKYIELSGPTYTHMHISKQYSCNC